MKDAQRKSNRPNHSLAGSISQRFKAYCGALGLNPKKPGEAIANMREREARLIALYGPPVPPHPSGHLASFSKHR